MDESLPYINRFMVILYEGKKSSKIKENKLPYINRFMVYGRKSCKEKRKSNATNDAQTVKLKTNHAYGEDEQL